MTLYRWLERAVAGGLVCQDGTGRRADPFRYWLPSREEAWKNDPMYEFDQKIKENAKYMDKLLGRR